MSKQLTDTEKACIAANFLKTEWNEWLGKCIYHDDASSEDYICNCEEEMVDLYDLIVSDDSETRRDAYSLWCSQTCHEIA